jgi:hypothetical protein
VPQHLEVDGCMTSVGRLRNQAESRRQLRELRAELAKANTAAQRRPGWMLAATGTLFLALLSVGLTGALVGANTTNRSVIQQQTEEKSREARERRGQVYAEYITATDAYVDELTRFANLKKETAADRDRLILLYRSFKTKGDLVTVYGSDDAFSAHRIIVEALPEVASHGPGTTGFLINEDGSIGPNFDGQRYLKGYSAFKDAFCREASAQPRSGCK